ncbi:peptide chain release factor 3 [Verrucomicrobiales bacterium BCK34]|nr:peptide chain release factor 3 [Verrucomicrobiales bacterium BCK34]
MTAPTKTVSPDVAREIDRRRTFAIISHPDAGKTTLTEKLLLYGGAIHLAGSVTARKNQNSTASDWMDMEKERGISVSSTVLQFDYDGSCVNLLDTPGHHDFSEDTYRVLSAVDSAVMVIDAGKGIEAQTLKLFEVCRKRGVPIFVFVNKLDRPSRPPLELIDELERVLGLPPVPLNWPLGDGPRFRGIFNRETNEVNLFERTPHGSYKSPLSVGGIDDEKVAAALDTEIHETAKQEIDLLDGVTEELDMERVLAGKQMPIFFGSAMNNFGVELMLKRFLELAPKPAPRKSEEGPVNPHHDAFSGFVFKIQANMNPRHRDRAVFVRIVSGTFERDMQVTDIRSGKKVRLSNAQKLFGQDRETLDEAYAGDILALVGNYDFLIGDTLTSDSKIVYNEMPRFKPECFAYIFNSDTANIKRYRSGIEQLLKEGVAQAYDVHQSAQRVPLLGAVGPLQFEVMKARLENEYNVECRLEQSPWSVAQWLRPKAVDPEASKRDAPNIQLPSGSSLALDQDDNWMALLPAAYLVSILHDRNEAFEFSDSPFRD